MSVLHHVFDELAKRIRVTIEWEEYRRDGDAWKIAVKTNSHYTLQEVIDEVRPYAQGNMSTFYRQKYGPLIDQVQSLEVELNKLRGHIEIFAREEGKPPRT